MSCFKEENARIGEVTGRSTSQSNLKLCSKGNNYGMGQFGD